MTKTSRTHGRGKKGGRGAGLKGGRGRAGYHKHQYTRMLKLDPEHFGMHGFVRQTKAKKTINVGSLPPGEEIHLEGYDKLLGGGRVTRPMRIWVPRATPKATNKVKEAGGEVFTQESLTQESLTREKAERSETKE